MEKHHSPHKQPNNRIQLLMKLNSKLDNYFQQNNIQQDGGKIPITDSISQNDIYKNLEKIKQQMKIKSLNKPQKVELSQFQLGRSLGSGQYGEVSLALHLPTNMIFAMKIINKSLINNPKCKNQIKDEIKNQIYLQHPNIIKLYAVFHDQANVYMVMEYANQGQMYEILKRKGRLEEKKVVYYLKQIISALQFMHFKNIIHRDIKAENLLLSSVFILPQDVIKLCDFGWSAQYNTRTRNSFCGTLDYVPPEVIRGEAQQTQLDVWTLGVLAYELITGFAPFETDSKQKTLEKIQMGSYHFPYHVSPLAQDFIKRLLKLNPLERMSLEEMLMHPWFQIDIANK